MTRRASASSGRVACSRSSRARSARPAVSARGSGSVIESAPAPGNTGTGSFVQLSYEIVEMLIRGGTMTNRIIAVLREIVQRWDSYAALQYAAPVTAVHVGGTR
ncbi:hypothetical protein GCM10009869_11460 [Amnibacterium kyonggiense]